ncbi:MAG: hypothetical protein KF874_09430 [Rhizobiaceae bacterium]|nr:hypothetical protein [Rhizobiaceae bacterium]
MPPSPAANLEPAACKLVIAREIEAYAGEPVFVEDNQSQPDYADTCSWKGLNHDISIKVMLFKPSDGGRDKERAIFDQMIEKEKELHEPGEFVAVPELAEDAWALDLSENPTQFYAVYVFSGERNAAITTTNIGLEGTVAIARHVASRM